MAHTKKSSKKSAGLKRLKRNADKKRSSSAKKVASLEKKVESVEKEIEKVAKKLSQKKGSKKGKKASHKRDEKKTHRHRRKPVSVVGYMWQYLPKSHQNFRLSAKGKQYLSDMFVEILHKVRDAAKDAQRALKHKRLHASDVIAGAKTVFPHMGKNVIHNHVMKHVDNVNQERWGLKVSPHRAALLLSEDKVGHGTGGIALIAVAEHVIKMVVEHGVQAAHKAGKKTLSAKYIVAGVHHHKDMLCSHSGIAVCEMGVRHHANTHANAVRRHKGEDMEDGEKKKSRKKRSKKSKKSTKKRSHKGKKRSSKKSSKKRSSSKKSSKKRSSSKK